MAVSSRDPLARETQEMSNIQQFPHSRGEGEPARRKQGGRIADHVGLRTRSSSAAAIGLASSGGSRKPHSSREGTREARPRLPHELFPRPPLPELDCRGVGAGIQRNFRWFLHLLVSKASSPRRIVLWLFVLFQGSLVAVSNQIQSLLLLLDADLCAVWTFGALGFRIIPAIRKIQIARSTLLVFTEKKRMLPIPTRSTLLHM